MQMSMAAGIAGKAFDDLETEPAIELRRLEAVGGEQDLKAPAAPRLRLRQLEKPTTDPLPAMLLVHPDLTNLAAPAPGVPAESGDDLTLSIAAEDREAQRIEDSGRPGVELVQALLQEVDLRRRRIGSEDELEGCLPHGRTPGTPRRIL